MHHVFVLKGSNHRYGYGTVRSNTKIIIYLFIISLENWVVDEGRNSIGIQLIPGSYVNFDTCVETCVEEERERKADQEGEFPAMSHRKSRITKVDCYERHL